MTVVRFSEQFELLIDRQTSSETGTLIIWSTACLADWPNPGPQVSWAADWQVDGPIDDCASARLTYWPWLTHWLVDWLFEQQTHHDWLTSFISCGGRRPKIRNSFYDLTLKSKRFFRPVVQNNAKLSETQFVKGFCWFWVFSFSVRSSLFF